MKVHIQNLIATGILLAVSGGYYGLITNEIPGMQIPINLFIVPIILGFVYSLNLTGQILIRVGYACAALIFCTFFIFSQPSDPAVPGLGDLVGVVILAVFSIACAAVFGWKAYRTSRRSPDKAKRNEL